MNKRKQKKYNGYCKTVIKSVERERELLQQERTKLFESTIHNQKLQANLEFDQKAINDQRKHVSQLETDAYNKNKRCEALMRDAEKELRSVNPFHPELAYSHEVSYPGRITPTKDISFTMLDDILDYKIAGPMIRWQWENQFPLKNGLAYIVFKTPDGKRHPIQCTFSKDALESHGNKVVEWLSESLAEQLVELIKNKAGVYNGR